MRPDQGPHRSPRKKQQNPVSKAISTWVRQYTDHSSGDSDQQSSVLDLPVFVDTGPRRWVVYEPMVLLPSGSFNSSPWKSLLAELDETQKSALWQEILNEIFSRIKEHVTHLAVNEGIPLHVGAGGAVQDHKDENILRSPSGLWMLYGDFGPAAPTASLDQAFWVTTKQNGIFQTWAPRWTMFSRGNVKEKARLLSFHNPAPAGSEEAVLARRSRSPSTLKDKWAVDLYAGIGYFVFSYARLGMRVMCWELNPYSVEGLRRGALRNGWTVRVIAGNDLDLPTSEIVCGEERIIVFLEDNERALHRVRELRETYPDFEALHVNCGFLPTSEPTWKPSLQIVGEGWLHLHENVGAKDIENRRKAICEMLGQWTESKSQDCWVDVEHVELVKTYAPDVWHCVFDVYVTRSRSN